MNIQLPEPTFDTTAYNLSRKPNNTIVRVFIDDNHEEDELTQEFHQYQFDFHAQIVANSRAQLDKLAAFELENPPFEIDKPPVDLKKPQES